MYNEEKRIRHCLERTLEYCIQQSWDFEILVVEDGCSDNSANIVKEFADYDNRIILISLPQRYGKGGSILRAIDYCKKSNIGFIDVDLSADPSEFERLIPFIEKYDVVIGSRIIRGSLKEAKRPRTRKFLSNMYHLLFRCLFAINIHDLQCGFKLFRKDSLSSVLREVKINGFAFDTEFLVISKLNGLRIKEVPIVWSHDANSKLKLSKTIFNMGKDLLKIWSSVFKAQLYSSDSLRGKFVARPIILFEVISHNPFIKRSIKQNVFTR